MNPLQQVFVPPILSAQTPTKFIIEVANSTYQVLCVRIYYYYTAWNIITEKTKHSAL